MRLALVKKSSNVVAELEAEIDRLRAEGAEATVAVERLTAARVDADSFDQAAQIDEEIRRAEWAADRAAGRLPALEAELAAAKFERQQDALVRHRRAIAALYPKLRAAVEAAAAVQVAARAAREAAELELGAALASEIPHIGFRGLLLPDLVQLWIAENDRIWAVPWQPPAPPAKPARSSHRAPQRSEIAHRIAQPGGEPLPQKPVAMNLLPAPQREPRALHAHPAPAPGSGLRRVRLIRSGADFGDGDIARIGDVMAVPERQANALVKNGAADFEDVVKQ